jgi:amino acid transporter
MSTAEPTTSRPQLGGSKKLSLVDAIAQSVGFMGPVFSIAFLVPLLVGLNASGKGAGTAAPLSVLIASVGVFGLGWIVSEYAKRIQAAGSLYDYVSDGLGGRIGAAAGFLYYVGILALGAGLLVMISGTLHDILAGEFNKTPLSKLGWDIVLLVLVAAIMYLGVALSTRAQLVLALISITVVLIFSIVVIAKVGGGNHVGKAISPSSSPQGFNGVLFGVLYGVLLFTGFETAANLGEETAHPKRDIPRAVLISVIAVAGFYLIGSYAQVAGYHFDLAAFGKNAASGPLFGLAGPASEGGYGAVAIRRLIELVVVFDMLAVLIGISVASSRGFFAMARDDRLPRPMAKISRRGTPLVASGVVLAVFVVAIVLTETWHGLFALPQTPHYLAMFSWGSTFGGFGLSLIYLLMCVGAIRGLADHPKLWAVYLAATLGILVSLAALFGSVYKVKAPIIYAPYACAGVFVVGLLLTLVFPGRARPVTTFAELTPTEQGPIKI